MPDRISKRIIPGCSRHSWRRANLNINGRSIPFFSVYMDLHSTSEAILDRLIHGRVCFPNAHRRDRLALGLFPLSDIALHVVAARVRLCVRRRLVFRSSLALKIPCFCRPATKSAIELQINVVPQRSLPNEICEGQTYRPVALLISPPSSKGISRLSPAPDAAEPTVTVEPGNLVVAASLMPESWAVRCLVLFTSNGGSVIY